MFRIALDNGHEAIGYASGKMRRYRIKMFPGDRVRIEISPYDLDQRTHRLSATSRSAAGRLPAAIRLSAMLRYRRRAHR